MEISNQHELKFLKHHTFKASTDIFWDYLLVKCQYHPVSLQSKCILVSTDN